MRQKKREYLESQRAATLARMAESQVKPRSYFCNQSNVSFQAALHAKREANRTIQVQKQIPQGYQYQQPVPGYQQYPPTGEFLHRGNIFWKINFSKPYSTRAIPAIQSTTYR